MLKKIVELEKLAENQAENYKYSEAISTCEAISRLINEFKDSGFNFKALDIISDRT
jgi:hypothetical protein